MTMGVGHGKKCLIISRRDKAVIPPDFSGMRKWDFLGRMNEEIFDSLADARRKLALWRYDYNDDRPHSAIGYNVPSALYFPGDATSPSP